VGDEPPIHIESEVTTAWDRADAGHEAPGRRASARRVVRGPGRLARLVGVVAVVGLLGGGLLWWARDGGRDGGDEPSCGGIGGDRARAARIAFYPATHRLLSAGSFAYRGEVHAAEQSPLRPGGWTAGDATVEGAVVLEQGLTHDIAVDASGRAAETVTSGPKVWTRSASTVDGLGTAPWAVRTSVGRPLPLLGTAAVTYLLLSGRDPKPVAPNPAGRCVIRASVPAVDRRDPYADPFVGVDLLVTLDGDGNLARIVVTSAPDDPELVLDLDITQIGEPQAIALPGSGSTVTALTGTSTSAASKCVASGEAATMVPDVLGETLPDAIDIVQGAGLNVLDDGVPEADPTGEGARVRAQEPHGGDRVPVGACVGFRTER
jgi:PASTA domain